MKKILYPILTGLLLTVACSEEFLDQDIPVKREISAFYNTPDEIFGGLLEAYSALQEDGLSNARWVFGDMASDDAIKGGEGAADLPEMGEIAEFRPLTTNSVVRDLWNLSYAGIAKANVIIEKIEDVDFGSDETLKKQYLAEAQFLRAFNYYSIARAFGDAPLITVAITDFADVDPVLLQKTPVAEIWKLVEEDLTAAMPNMATRSELAEGGQWGRAPKGAAQALLAKALMFQRKYNEAVPVLKALVESGNYQLETDDFGKLFREEGEFSKENIFEIPFANSATGWGNDCEGSARFVFQLNRSETGYGANMPTQDLADEFEEGDPRIIYTLNWPDDAYQEDAEGNSVRVDNDNSPYGYSNRKIYMVPSARSAGTFCAGKNEIIFRLADIYLLYAEALVQSGGDEATALFYLNEIRKRANNTPKVDPQRLIQSFEVSEAELPMRESSGEQLLHDIYHERRVELAMEGIRWWDLVRQGRTDLIADYYQEWSVDKGFDSKGDLNGKFYTQWMSQIGKTEYPIFPVPQSEIDASQGSLIQTKGY